MAGYTKSVERLQAEFLKLPGIGARSAERLAFHILKATEEEALALAEAIREVKANVRPCARCFNLAEGELCAVCSDPRRDTDVICVVEQPKDVLSLEDTGAYNGLYHVLMGQIVPLEGTGPEDLTIDALLQRVGSGQVREVIMATNPTVAGDATALYIIDQLKPFTNVTVTRLARGLPAGGSIELASKSILSDAIAERRKL
ncbi:MAG: recombination protein RecR [Planctomycetes bacterium]|nr:recombination protein RecR [Planctomycetota bacterium]